MSLDVYLEGPPETGTCACPRCGNTHMNTEPVEWYWANITHNLYRMAEAAGIGNAVWQPEMIGITHAAQLIEPLQTGIARMKADPAHFKHHDAPNGWGTYTDFVPWLERYLAACEEHPEATVRTSR